MNGKTVPGKKFLYEGKGGSFMKTTKILLAGRLDFGPLARHLRAFIEALAQRKENQIYLDPFMLEHYRCDSFGTQTLLNEYLAQNNVMMATKGMNYDFSVFTDLLTLNYGDTFYKNFLKYKSKIKICYEVFDGSLPPLDWIDIINSNFDICCTPSMYIADCLIKGGVKIPCFDLPCVVFNDQLLKKQPCVSREKVRFGFVGGAEQRKNLLKVLDAFYKAFQGKKDVELYIHSSYTAEPAYAQECAARVKKYKKDCDIIFNFEKRLSKNEMYDMISTFSFYVFPTKNTGYFTTPCEALSVGIPVIISDIPVHQELTQNLTQQDGAFLIKANEIDVMIHSYLGNKCLGVQYDMSVDAIVEQMLAAYEHRKILFTKEKIEKRKAVARQYSLASLTPVFNNLFHPDTIYLSKRAGITQEELFLNSEKFNSEKLVKKYQALNENIKLSNDKEFNEKRYTLPNPQMGEFVERICLNIEKAKLSLCPTGDILGSHYMKRMIARAQKYRVSNMPWFIYKLFSQYCKLKSLITKESK